MVAPLYNQRCRHLILRVQPVAYPGMETGAAEPM
jgi:hypothetical protein